MAFFNVGDLYRRKYLIESVVPFFQGELAIAVYEDKRYYLQSASLNRQAPLRAISQYRNLKLPQVIPYLDVFDEPDMLVFIRPYIEIRPLRDIITTQELSEEQVVKWVRGLLHVEAVLRSKPMPMYLLLDLRNIGVDSQNELKVFFCGLEQIMVYESKLDWGTFIYSMLSGQFLDGPILRLPKNFKVSRPMARLIQKSFKEYTVPPVLEQVEIFENKNTSGGLLSKFWGEKKDESNGGIVANQEQKQDSLVTLSNRPIYRAEQNSGTKIHLGKEATTVFTDDRSVEENERNRVIIRERGSLVKEDDKKDLNKISKEQQESSVTTVFKENTDGNDESTNSLDQETTFDTEWLLEEEPLIGAKDKSTPLQIPDRVIQPQSSHLTKSEETNTSSPVFQTESTEISFKEGAVETPSQKPEQTVVEAKADEDSDEEQSSDDKVEDKEIQEESKKEERLKTHPDSNQSTVTVSPALAQLEGQDLSQSFVLKLNKQQEELEREQEERLRKMREEYERREQELIEQHRKKLEEEQKRLLEEQRKKLEQQQEELLKLKREELARLEEEARLAKERKEKEERRKAKLAAARKQFEEKQKIILEQEEQAFLKRQEELLTQLQAEYEQRKAILLQQQEEEYQARTKAKLATLTAEWEQLEASTDEENINIIEFKAIPNQVTEESEKAVKGNTLPVFQSSEDLGGSSPVKEPKSPEAATSSEQNTEPVFAEVEPITQGENEEIENVFAEVIPSTEPEPIKEMKKQVEESKLQPKTAPETKQQAKQKQQKTINAQQEAVIGKPEEVESKPEVLHPIQTEETETNAEENTTGTTEEAEITQETSGEEAPKKKRRRRRRRRKKKSAETGEAGESSLTVEVAATITDSNQEVQSTATNANNISKEAAALEAERRRRELELQQMERELLEMEQQESQNKPQKQEPPKVNKIEESIPKKIEKEETSQAPVVAKKPEVPVVKDTTEHATLAKQFEQYLKLFKRKK